MSLLAKNYRQASFRGAKFNVDVSEFQTGRRTVDRVFPKRNVPSSQDLGRKAQGFTLDAYVNGEGYEAARDALIRACEKEGPGYLIHPYLGSKRVVCKDCRIREKKNELGFAQISLTFIESGELIYPEISGDSLAAMESAADAVNEASASNLETVFDSLTDAASFVVSAVEEKLDLMCDAMDTVAKGIKSRTQSIADFSYRVRNIRANITRLVQTPAELASEFQDAIGQLAISLGASKKDVRLAYSSLASFGSGFTPVTQSTSNRAIQANAETGLSFLVRRTAVAGAALAAADETFESLDDAEQARDILTAEIDSLIEGTTGVQDDDDNVLNALQTLRKQVLQSVPKFSDSLPQLVDFTPPNSTNSLLVSYQIYETVENADEIVSRNKISHPAFIPGGKALRVLRGGT